jgi:hypothetical protein
VRYGCRVTHWWRPRVTKQMPGRPVALPTASAIMGRRLLTADSDRDIAIVRGVEDREIAFTWHAEGRTGHR